MTAAGPSTGARRPLAWGLAVALIVLGGLGASRGCAGTSGCEYLGGQDPAARVDGAIFAGGADAGPAAVLDGAVFKAPPPAPPAHPAGPEGAIFP